MHGKKIRPHPWGFTIVELLVVIVVIGILASITIISYTGVSQKATIASITSDLDNASRQLKLYQVTNSAYPTALDCSSTPAANSICIKSSPSSSYIYQYNNRSNPQSFNIIATNGTTRYYVTNDSAATAYTSVVATGGTITDIDGYRIHTFNSSGTFTVTSAGIVEVLVVAGGGGGGGNSYHGGGGGGGGVIYNPGFPVVSGTPYTVTIGNGGAAYVTSNDGQNSILGSLIAIGGGGGGNSDTAGRTGGSGGGAGVRNSTGGSATSGQGYSGGSGRLAPESPNYGAGGGGGAGGIGGNGTQTSGGNGGDGLSFSVSGVTVYYGGGGGGSVYSNTTSGAGGLGGGGAGAYGPSGGNGVANSGGGGGGRDSRGAENKGTGVGGSGIVIVRYLLP